MEEKDDASEAISEWARNIAEHACEGAIGGKSDHHIEDSHFHGHVRYVDDVRNGEIPMESHFLNQGLIAHWDADRTMVVIQHGDSGPVFKPSDGESYF
jgi:hypothetical protein